MKLASLKGGARRPACGRLARSVALRRRVGHCADPAGGARRLGRAGAAPDRTRRMRWRPGRIEHLSVRSEQMRFAVAARLSMGGRLGLRQSRRAGAQGARRGDAGDLLDRSADVSGRLGYLSSGRATDPRSSTKPGASISKRRSSSSWAMCRWARRASRRRRRSG